MDNPRLFLILLIVSLGALGGCSSAISFHAVKEAVKGIESLDGIDRDEAVILAQDHIVSTGLAGRLHSLRPFEVKERTVWKKDNETIEFVIPPGETFEPSLQHSWVVLFRDKKGSFFGGVYPIMPFYVEVERQSGKILDWGIKK